MGCRTASLQGGETSYQMQYDSWDVVSYKTVRRSLNPIVIMSYHLLKGVALTISHVPLTSPGGGGGGGVLAL